MDILSSPSYLPSPWYSVRDDSVAANTEQQLQSAKDRAASVDRLIKLYGDQPKSTRYTNDLLTATKLDPANQHHHVRIDTSPSSSPIVSKYLVDLAPRSQAASSASSVPLASTSSLSASNSDLRDRVTFNSSTSASAAPAVSSLISLRSATAASLPHQKVTLATAPQRPRSSLAFTSSSRDKYSTSLQPTPPSSSHHVSFASAAPESFLEIENFKHDSIGEDAPQIINHRDDDNYLHDHLHKNGLTTRASVAMPAASDRFLLPKYSEASHGATALHSEYSKERTIENHAVTSELGQVPARPSLSSVTTSRPYSNFLTTPHPMPPNHNRYYVDVVRAERDASPSRTPASESTHRRISASGAGLRVTFADTERVSYKQMLIGDSPPREQQPMTSSLSSSLPLNAETTTSLEVRQKHVPLELPPSEGSRLNDTVSASTPYRTAYQLAFSTTLPNSSSIRNKSDASMVGSASFRQTPFDYHPQARHSLINQSTDTASWKSFIQEKSPVISNSYSAASKLPINTDHLSSTPGAKFTPGADRAEAAAAAGTSSSNDLFLRNSWSMPFSQGQGHGTAASLLEVEQRAIGRLDGAAERMANIYNSSSYSTRSKDEHRTSTLTSDVLHKPTSILSNGSILGSPSAHASDTHWSRQPDVLAPVSHTFQDTAARRSSFDSSSGSANSLWSRTSSNNASLQRTSDRSSYSHARSSSGNNSGSTGNDWQADDAETLEPVTSYGEPAIPRASPKLAVTNITLNVSDNYYVKQIQAIVGRTGFVDNPYNYLCSSGPARLLPYLYIGGYREADDLACLKRLGITHVLNCAAADDTSRLQHTHNGKASPYPAGCSVIAYEQFDADDDEDYDILQHFDQARQFIDRAKYTRGRCLVHCAMGINRSGAICAAYILLDQQLKLLDVVRLMKQRRGTVLWNRGFQRMLVRFARQRGLL